jgi:hypothetical protein
METEGNHKETKSDHTNNYYQKLLLLSKNLNFDFKKSLNQYKKQNLQSIQMKNQNLDPCFTLKKSMFKFNRQNINRTEA